MVNVPYLIKFFADLDLCYFGKGIRIFFGVRFFNYRKGNFLNESSVIYTLFC